MRVAFCLLVLIACGFCSGCKTVATEPSKNRTTSTNAPAGTLVSTRNNSLSLLYQILGDEQNVSKLLIVKRDRKELHAVIKKISVSAGNMVKLLEGAAKQDTTLNLKETDLPPGEKAARDAESKAVTKELLLHTHGQEFEFKLLLTQTQALEYASSLAKVAAVTELDATRRKLFTDMSAQLHVLDQEVLGLLRQPHPKDNGSKANQLN